jgi:hypothetical protein
MDFSQLSEENHDIELSKVFAKIDKIVSKIDSIDIKHVIVDTACLENSCLTNHVMPKSKDTGTQAHGKFVPTCHNCEKIGHIRPNCYLLKSPQALD